MTDMFNDRQDEVKRQSALYTKIQTRLALALAGGLAVSVLACIYVVVHFVIKLW